MSSSTWRMLSGYATYQRTPMRMTSWGKGAPLKLVAIVALPHDGPLLTGEDHTANRLKEKLRQNPCASIRPLPRQPPAPALSPPGGPDECLQHSKKLHHLGGR